MTRSLSLVMSIAASLVVGCKGDPPLLSAVHVSPGRFRAQILCWPEFKRGCELTYLPGARTRLILWLGGFWADKRLVRSTQYDACVSAGACAGPPNPVNNRWRRPAMFRDVEKGFAFVPVEQAATYCRWRGWRLPTPDEYERMARWTDGRTYAWGDHDCKSCRGRASPDGIRELNWVEQWVVTIAGVSAMMGGDDSASLQQFADTAAAFRCVYTPSWDPTPGVGRVIEPSGDPWDKGGPF